MKRKISIVTVLLMLSQMMIINHLYAARADVGTSGAVFLKLNPGSRSAAMGETFAGIADDVNAIYYNPAGTANIEKAEFTAQYGVWFQGIDYNALGFVYPLKDVGTFGLGITNLSVTDIERRSSDTLDAEGKFQASDYAYLLHYSRTVLNDLTAGINVKIISQKIDDQTASAYAADAGVLWKTPFKNLSAGLAVQNMGTEIKFINEGDPMPLNIKFGFGYYWIIKERSQITAGIDANMPRDNDMLFSGGAEFKYKIREDIAAAVRAGYKTVSQEQLGGLSGITGGAGLSWKQFGFDFAWVPYGDLGDTFRYSLIVKF